MNTHFLPMLSMPKWGAGLGLALALFVSPQVRACADCFAGPTAGFAALSDDAKAELKAIKKVRTKNVVYPRNWPLKAFVPRQTEVTDVVEEKKEKEEKRLKLVKKYEAKGEVPAKLLVKDEEDGFVKEGEFKGFRIYETHHYRFLSEVKLSPEAMLVVGELFECAYAANQALATALPVVRIKAKAKKSRRGEKITDEEVSTKFLAVLFKDRDSYKAAGAPPTTAGYFSYRSHHIGNMTKESDIIADRTSMPLESIGLSEEGEVLEEGFDPHVLVHELTHQFTCLNRLPIWLNEGLSEYMGYLPFDGEDMDFKLCFASILYQARMRGKADRLLIPFEFADFLTMSQEKMYDYMQQTVDTYMLASMYVCYFVHLDRQGYPNFVKYMEALNQGKPNEECVELLLGKMKSMDELAEAFVKAWEKQGVKIEFEGDDGKNWGDK